MSIFSLYFKLGIEHILDLVGYDHILFLVTLCAVYRWVEWRKVLILITAFTIGHTITLLLATIGVIVFPVNWIEFLIPLTIFVTALANIFIKNEKSTSKFHWFKYSFALFFGLIHGLGFSNYLKMLLGSEENLIYPLFAFNLGIELGQLIILSVVFGVTGLILKFFPITPSFLSKILSTVGLLISFYLLISRWPF